MRTTDDSREIARCREAVPLCRFSSTEFNVHFAQGRKAAVVNGDKDAKQSTWKHWYFLLSVASLRSHLTREKMIRPWQLALKRAPISARCRRCFCGINAILTLSRISTSKYAALVIFENCEKQEELLFFFFFRSITGRPWRLSSRETFQTTSFYNN